MEMEEKTMKMESEAFELLEMMAQDYNSYSREMKNKSAEYRVWLDCIETYLENLAELLEVVLNWQQTTELSTVNGEESRITYRIVSVYRD